MIWGSTKNRPNIFITNYTVSFPGGLSLDISHFSKIQTKVHNAVKNFEKNILE